MEYTYGKLNVTLNQIKLRCSNINKVTRQKNKFSKNLKLDLNFLVPENIINMLNEYKNICQYCGKDLFWKNLIIEHILPRQCEGLTNIENITFSCKKCNNSKGYLNKNFDYLKNKYYEEYKIKLSKEIKFTPVKLRTKEMYDLIDEVKKYE